MVGDRNGTVVEVRPFAIHGVPHVDVTIAWRDGGTATARLGAESVPDGIEPGDEVLARLVMSSVVALERAGADPP